jgi:hypothetical protein
MAKTLSTHGPNMAQTWSKLSPNMDRIRPQTWPKHGLHMAQTWPEYSPNTMQTWPECNPNMIQNTHTHTCVRLRAPARARSRTCARLLGGGDLRALVAPLHKTPLTRLMGRCHIYMYLYTRTYVHIPGYVYMCRKSGCSTFRKSTKTFILVFQASGP